MKRLAIGIDMDDVIWPFMETLLAEYNKKYFDHLTIDDLTDWDTSKFLKSECKSFFDEFATYSLLVTMDVAEGAVNVLSALHRNHDIFFVTAGFPNTIGARDEWLMKQFPFYTHDKLIRCVDKSMITLDVLVDDCMKNIVTLPPTCQGVIMNRPWNIELPTPTKAKRISLLAELPEIIEHYADLDTIMKGW